MSIAAIRYRTEGEFVVLQVREDTPASYDGYRTEAKSVWRDAKVTDLLDVAAYTRSHDTLDRLFQSMQGSIQGVQESMFAMQAREMERAQDSQRAVRS